jgi:zinc protease
MKRVLIGFVAMLSSSVSLVVAADAPAADVAPIKFERETLDNGLRVIYAPMTNAPVVHLRVMYHVGSKDEAADRNGFAHMFEHMMFRGSAHVPSEQHMKLIQGCGGVSNAFTTFDQTTYVNTIPTNALQMALWLEADRMASLKVTDDVFKTERNVVKEEWRLRYANQPYGYMNSDLFRLAFKDHNYKWPTIGDMDHLAAAQVQELQDFHDHYYVPNNACLVIAGQFDVAAVKDWVHKYYAWIPKGTDIVRVTKQEAPQTEEREKIVTKPALPFARISMVYKGPDYRSEDHLAIECLTTIVGGGRSSRMYQALVANDPIAAQAQMGNYQLDDPGVIFVGLGVLPGKDPAEAIARTKAELKKVIEGGVTQEELDKAKTQTRNEIVQGRSTAESIATSLCEEEVFGGDAERANTYLSRLEKLTPDDIKAAAAKYLVDSALSVVEYKPGAADSSADQAKSELESAAKIEAATKPGAPVTDQPVAAVHRKIEFPSDFPTSAPLNDEALAASFAKGKTEKVNGIDVITMTDNRLPVVSATLVLRGGSHAAAADKEGVASLTTQMLSRGAGGMTAKQLADELENHGVSVGANDDGDVTRLTAFAPSEQIEFALGKLKQIALQPEFPADEFNKLKRQSMQGLMGQLSNPGSVADRELDEVIYGNGPLGRNVTPQTLMGITLDDVKNYYQTMFKTDDALMVFAGDITQEKANTLAKTLLDGFQGGKMPAANYDVPTPDKRQIILVDNPDGQQAVVRMGLKAYDLKTEDRFAGSIAGQVLSSGIDSRLNRVLRAEKGLTYGAYGYFRPNRHGGAFELSIETKLESVDDAITSTFGVLKQMKDANITDAELAEAKRRTAGSMVLETQTIQQQAGRRVDTVLNGYPIDYYDNYAKRIGQVTADQVRDVLGKYVIDDKTNIIVVGPASKVEAQLKKFGDVKVVPMPLEEAKKLMGGMGPAGRGAGAPPTSQPAK